MDAPLRIRSRGETRCRGERLLPWLSGAAHGAAKHCADRVGRVRNARNVRPEALGRNLQQGCSLMANSSKRWYRTVKWSGALLCVACHCGCVRTTIRSGQAPGSVATNWQDRWHHAYFLGLDERPGPVVLDEACPNGWAEVDASIDPMQAVIALATLGIYTPSTITVVCSDPNFVDSMQ